MSASPTATYSLLYTATTSQPITSSRAAALIFGPELYSLYVNWQTDIEGPEQAALYPSRRVWKRTIQAVRKEKEGRIPSPHTFRTFMDTQRVKEQLYMQDAEGFSADEDCEDEGDKKKGTPGLLIARLCKHPVHPGNPQMKNICPECLMSQCIASLDRIAHVWRLVGGPLKPCPSEDIEVSQIYHAIKRIWHVEKVRWADLVDVCEQCAEEEKSWEDDCRQNGLMIPTSVIGSSSCMEALELAMLTPFLAEGWSDTFFPKRRLKTRRVGGELQRTSVVGHNEGEIPHFSPSLNPEQEILRCFDGTSGQLSESDEQNDNGIDGANMIRSPFAPRSPSASSDSTIYASPLPLVPPCSLPQTPSQLHLHPHPMIGVHFPDDLPSPISRRRIYYRRSSLDYTPGEHASPAGSVWADTSFKSDYSYDRLGGTQYENEDPEGHRIERIDDCDNEMLQMRGNDSIDNSLNIVLEKEIEEKEGVDGDWHDESDFDDEEDDLIVFTGRQNADRKRLPGQLTGSKIRQPVFLLSWQKQAKPEETNEINDGVVLDEFEDEDLEQSMPEMDPVAMDPSGESAANINMPMIASGGAEEMGMVSQTGPETQVNPRRRCHDDFNEFGKIKEEEHLKRRCQ